MCIRDRSTAKEVMRKAHYLVDKGIIDPTNMIGDYVSTQLSLGLTFLIVH